MDTGKLITLGVIGAAGYFAWNYFSSLNAPESLVKAQPSIAPSGTQTVTPTIAQQIKSGIANQAITSGFLVNEAYAEGVERVSGGPQLTASQWNYALNKITGIPGQTYGDAGNPMSAGAYLSLISNWANAQG